MAAAVTAASATDPTAAAQMEQFKQWASVLLDPKVKDDTKYQALQSIADSLEVSLSPVVAPKPPACLSPDVMLTSVHSSPDTMAATR